MKDKLFKLSPWLILVAFVVLPLMFAPRALDVMRVKAFDVYQNLWERPASSAPVYVVDLDEESMAQHGQWPWPRTLVAELVEKTFSYNVASMGLDVVFAEADGTSPAQIAKTWAVDEALKAQITTLPDHDKALKNTVESHPVVLGYTLKASPIGAEQGVPPHAGTVVTTPSAQEWLISVPSLVRNTTELDTSSAVQGWFGYQALLDNIIRNVPLFVKYQDTVLPSLSMEALRQGLLAKGMDAAQSYRVTTRQGYQGASLTQLAGFNIHTDENARYWLRFRGYDASKYISAKDVLAGEDLPQLEGAIVLLGFSAMGLHDVRTTPLDAAVPGVEVHLQLLENILEGHNLIRYSDDIYIELLLVLIGGALMIIAMQRLGAVLGVLVSATIIASVVGFAFYQFYAHQHLYDWSYPLVSLVLLALMHSTLRYWKEAASKKEIRSAFGHYLSPSLVEILAEEPERLSLGGEVRNMTVLFSDIRGFTSISEGLTPQQLTSLLNRYLTPMTEVVQNNDGTIDKYMGDAVMAFWNAPLDIPEHTYKACATAVEMLQRLEELNIALKADGLPTLDIGIGVHTGEMSVGNMGSDQRFDYTVMGDNVNLGSRLEGLCKMYGVRILVSDDVVKALPKAHFMPLDKVAVKGKSLPVSVFELVSLDDMTKHQQENLNIMNKALSAYYGRQFAEAEELFKKLDGYDVLKDLYISRTKEFLKSPPNDDWDGVFYATQK